MVEGSWVIWFPFRLRLSNFFSFPISAGNMPEDSKDGGTQYTIKYNISIQYIYILYLNVRLVISVHPQRVKDQKLFCVCVWNLTAVTTVKVTFFQKISAEHVDSLSLLEFSVKLLSCRKFPIAAGRTGILLSDRSTVLRLLVSFCSSSGN